MISACTPLVPTPTALLAQTPRSLDTRGPLASDGHLPAALGNLQLELFFFLDLSHFNSVHCLRTDNKTHRLPPTASQAHTHSATHLLRHTLG